MIPNGWTRKKLIDLFDFKNGVNAGKEQYGRGTKFINISEIFKSNCIYESDIPASVEIDNSKVELYLVKKGDVVFNRTSETFDEIGLTAVYLDSARVVFGGFVIRARPITGELTYEYCKYAFSSDEIRREIIRRGQGAIRANIGQDDLGKVPIVIPPSAEQEKIAKILFSWDRVIEKLEELVQVKKLRKKGLMQQLLTGKKRFNGFNDHWTSVELSDVVKLSKEKHNPVKEKQSYKCIELEHIEQNTGRLLGFTDSQGLASIKTKFNKGDVLFGKLRPYLRKHFHATFNGVCTSEIWVLKPSERINSRFLYYITQSHKFIGVSNISSGSKMPRADWKVVQEFPIKLPSLKEQEKIAETLSNCDSEISLNTKEIELLKLETKGLMQQLLTGKKRVKV